MMAEPNSTKQKEKKKKFNLLDIEIDEVSLDSFCESEHTNFEVIEYKQKKMHTRKKRCIDRWRVHRI